MEWINQEIKDCISCYVHEEQWNMHYDICSQHSQMFRNDLNNLNKQKWISVKDQLPNVDYSNKKTSIRVLATDGNQIFYSVFHHLIKSEGIFGIFHTFCNDCLHGEIIKNITHWMPLPKPPDHDNETYDKGEYGDWNLNLL